MQKLTRSESHWGSGAFEKKRDIFSKIPLNLLLLASHRGESGPVSGPAAAGSALRGRVLPTRGEVRSLPRFNLGEKCVGKRISAVERRVWDIS